MSDTLVTSDLINLYDSAFLYGGFTVRYGDDGSLTPVTGGYAVSATEEQWSLPADLPFAEFAEGVEVLREMHPTANALGGWVCESGHLHLDPVEVTDSRARAEFLGRLRKQIVIFDLDSGEEIQL